MCLVKRRHLAAVRCISFMIHHSTLILILYFVGGPLFIVALLLICVLYCTRTRCLQSKSPHIASSPPVRNTPATVIQDVVVHHDNDHWSLHYIYNPVHLCTASLVHQCHSSPNAISNSPPPPYSRTDQYQRPPIHQLNGHDDTDNCIVSRVVEQVTRFVYLYCVFDVLSFVQFQVANVE